MNAPACLADYEIDSIDFGLVLQQAADLFRLDEARRLALAAYSPIPWDASKYGAEL